MVLKPYSGDENFGPCREVGWVRARVQGVGWVSGGGGGQGGRVARRLQLALRRQKGRLPLS